MVFLEIACFNSESALGAYEAGADRIELCEDAEVGGTTPALHTLVGLRDRISIPIYVMIRPRGGDFVYSPAEFEQMKADIDKFRAVASGFVFGLHSRDRKVDVVRTSELVRRAHPLPCTFHRAFDETTDWSVALEDVVKCGIRAVLTSGGKATATLGEDCLARLVEQADGRVVVMPGGGVRSGNIERLQRNTKATHFHSSALLEGEAVADADEIGQLKHRLLEASPVKPHQRSYYVG